MQKKVMALAVAGALAAPAAMAQVQIGGGIHLQYFMHDADNPSAVKDSDVLETSEPEIYVRGEEKLGGGLSVWFQCTSSFDVLGQGLGAWCGRNSAVGFRGDFGNVFFGTWDTPHKLVSNLARGWWGGTNRLQGQTLNILANGSDSNVGNATGAASFFRRHRRLVSYHSPDWSGFSVQAAFSSGNEATALPDSSPLSPRMYGVAGQFRTGPFFAGIGYETHNDFNGAVGADAFTGVPFPITTGGYTGGSDTSFNIAVGYTFFGALRASVLYMTNEYEFNGAQAVGAPAGKQKLEHDGFAVYVDWTLGGPHKLYFQYADRGDLEAAGVTFTATGAKVLGFAYGYSLSKRSQLYAGYNELKNDSSSAINMGTSATTVGGKQKVIGVGLRHSF